MIQLLPQSDTLKTNIANPSAAIEYISAYIDKYHCKNLQIDISHMNPIDASSVSIICATKHYMKYPDGRICWHVSSNLVKEFNAGLELGNNLYSEI